MSFILDALRKSEHARQKQTGPALAEVPVAAPKSRSNVWALAAVALLIVNLVAVGVLLLRRAAQAPAAAEASTAPAPATSAPAPDTSGPTTVTATAPTAATTTPPPVSREPAQASTGADDGRNPLAAEVGTNAVDPTLAVAAAAVPAGPPAVRRQVAPTPPRPGSVTYAPIPEAGDAPYTPRPAEPAPAARSAGNLPTADEITARGSLPELHLDLHVYSTVTQQRFIFVNSRKYREGETLQEGPRVEQITPDGAVLEYQGSRFRLSND